MGWISLTLEQWIERASMTNVRLGELTVEVDPYHKGLSEASIRNIRAGYNHSMHAAHLIVAASKANPVQINRDKGHVGLETLYRLA